MILILILAAISIQIIDVNAKKYSVIVDDELYPYTLENDVTFSADYFSNDHLILEQIDDDQLRVGGYTVCIKSMDSHMMLHGFFQTQHQENGVWKQGALRISLPDMCAELVNPLRPWYNVTKLWTKCPPEAEDKWFVEDQIVNVLIDLPPSFGKGRWRGYILFYQGILKVINKMGAMFQMEFVEIV